MRSVTATTWRLGEFETNARVLFCRKENGRVAGLAMVDGSTVRTHGPRRFAVSLPEAAPDFFVTGEDLPYDMAIRT